MIIVKVTCSHNDIVKVTCSHHDIVKVTCSHHDIVKVTCSHNDKVKVTCSHHDNSESNALLVLNNNLSHSLKPLGQIRSNSQVICFQI